MIKRIIAVLICITLVSLCICSASASEEIDELKQQRSALEEQEAEYQSILEGKNEELSDQKKVVDALVGKVQTINEEIKLSHEAIDSITDQIEDKEKVIEELNAEIELSMNVLKQRIKTIYIAGDVSSLEIILGAKDFTDFLDKVELVKSVSEHDEELINQVQGQLEVVNKEKEGLQADKLELETEEANLEKKQEELNETLEENKEILANLQMESNEAMASLSLTEDQIADLEQAILEKQAELAAQQSNYSSSESYNSHSTSVDIDVSVPEGGGWVWPAPGVYTITSNFYDTENRAASHGATDIAGPYGSPIVAAASGTVEYVCDECTHNWGKDYYCGCGGGYGNYIQIDHGGGKEAIYAHLQGVCVTAGQSVSAGEVIGYMGSTGHSTGSHLHFETRYYGTKYDPMTEY